MSSKEMFSELRSSSFRSPIPANRGNLSKVNIGDNFKIKGSYFRVDDKSTLTESNKSFSKTKSYVVTEFTLKSLKDGSTRYLEWAYDDELEIAMTDRKVKAADSGITEDMIKLKGNIILGGVKYGYEEKWHGIFEKDDDKYFLVLYEYESSNGEMLTLEGWSEDVALNDVDWEFYISHDMSSEEISIC